jgi:hypothetical protein
VKTALVDRDRYVPEKELSENQEAKSRRSQKNSLWVRQERQKNKL